MRFSLIIAPALAAVVAALPAADSADAPATTPAPSSSALPPPASLSDGPKAISSVDAEMSAQSPQGSSATQVFVTGTALPKATSVKPSKVSAHTTKAASKTTLKTSAKKPKSTSTKKAAPAASSKAPKPKRQAQGPGTTCQTQTPLYNYYPAGLPAADSNVVKQFLGDVLLNTTSSAASAPSGYQWMVKNWLAAVSKVDTTEYFGWTPMTSYNATACANICNSITYCNGFNIFYERDPTLNPGSTCADPTPFTNIKCTFWKGSLTTDTMTNYGEWRTNFAVVITGSNTYNKLST